jgi:hypothetical protein
MAKIQVTDDSLEVKSKFTKISILKKYQLQQSKYNQTLQKIKEDLKDGSGTFTAPRNLTHAH